MPRAGQTVGTLASRARSCDATRPRSCAWSPTASSAAGCRSRGRRRSRRWRRRWTGWSTTTGTVALSRNVPGKPGKVGAPLHGRTPRRVEPLDRAYDLSSLSGEVEAVARGDRSMQQCPSARGELPHRSGNLHLAEELNHIIGLLCRPQQPSDATHRILTYAMDVFRLLIRCAYGVEPRDEPLSSEGCGPNLGAGPRRSADRRLGSGALVGGSRTGPTRAPSLLAYPTTEPATTPRVS
jgi:hypothetical protein